MERTCCTLAPTPPVEDALRAIFVLGEQGDAATGPLLARQLRTTPQAASGIVERLVAHGLAVRTEDDRASLTRHGAAHARHVVRRYRLLGAFLTQVLTLTPDEVHAEADVLEHVASDRLLDRIDVLLGRPDRDPLGSAVPQPGEVQVAGWGTRLDVARPGSRFGVERVDDGDDNDVRHLADLQIRPGATLEVLRRAPLRGPMRVRLGDRELALGAPLARLVHGREAP